MVIETLDKTVEGVSPEKELPVKTLFLG